MKQKSISKEAIKSFTYRFKDQQRVIQDLLQQNPEDPLYYLLFQESTHCLDQCITNTNKLTTIDYVEKQSA
ncbi:hypothetical protein MJH12_13010 [bacterium]|nr:hypothetical protein [bacterium]